MKTFLCLNRKGPLTLTPMLEVLHISLASFLSLDTGLGLRLIWALSVQLFNPVSITHINTGGK